MRIILPAFPGFKIRAIKTTELLADMIFNAAASDNTERTEKTLADPLSNENYVIKL